MPPEVQDYLANTGDGEDLAIESFLKLGKFDQLKLMLWLTKRDASLCDKRIFIAFAHSCKDIVEL